jgi:ElaA protein
MRDMPSPDALTWTLVEWAALDREALYEALELRQLVFVVEQTCPYLDCDDRDREACHLFGRRANGELVAYARLFAPGVYYAEAAIGRVVTHPDARGEGFGKLLMNEAAERLRAKHGPVAIRIGAQRYLERFYGELGYVISGAPYMEDGIPHIQMVRRPGTGKDEGS